MDAGFAGAGNAGRPMLLEGGLSWQAMALSLLMFTGGSQFAFIGVVSGGGTGAAAFGAAASTLSTIGAAAASAASS